MRIKFLTDIGRFGRGDVADLPRPAAISYVQYHFAEETEDFEPPETKEDQIKSKGAGWYELPDGQKVRGKDNAMREIKSGR